MKLFNRYIFPCILIWLFCTSCNKYDTIKKDINITALNRPPLADAGLDQSVVFPVDSVLLKGSGKDLDGIITSYKWTKLSGPSGYDLVTPNASTTVVHKLSIGKYNFVFTVTDNKGAASKDTVQVIVYPPNTVCSTEREVVLAQLIPVATLPHPDVYLAGSLGSKLFFVGKDCESCDGYNIIDIYDVTNNSWSITRLSVPRYNPTVVSAGHKIFFAGGYNSDGLFLNEIYSIVDIYDEMTNHWSVTNLSVGREGIAAVSIGNKVFFAGGIQRDPEFPSNNGSSLYSKVVDIFDVNTTSWTTASLSEGRRDLSAVAVDDKVYFAGGFNGNGTVSTRIDMYELPSNTWSVSSLNEPKALMAGISYNNKVYWAGGVNSGNGSINFILSPTVEITDSKTNTNSLACLFQPAAFYNAVLENNKIVFLTANNWKSEPLTRFDIYDPATNMWSIGEVSEDLQAARASNIGDAVYVVLFSKYTNATRQLYKLEL